MIKFQYFDISGSLARVSLDENNDPNYCEVFDVRYKKFVRNNSILEDLYNDYHSIKLQKNEFQERLVNKQNTFTKKNSNIKSPIFKHFKAIIADHYCNRWFAMRELIV